MKLNIFTDLKYVPENIPYESILFPFYGQCKNKTDYFSNNIFNNYINQGQLFFQKTSLKEADLVILPINWEKVLTLEITDKLTDLIQQAKKTNTLSIGFFGGDCSHLKLDHETDLMFRHSLYASTKSAKDFAYPAWSKDILFEHLNGELPIKKEKPIKPTIGFCGFSSSKDIKAYCKFFIYKFEKSLLNRQIPRYHIGHVFRSLALSILSKSSLLNSNLIIRNKAFFHNNKNNIVQQKKQNDQFIQNMVDSNYILCCRGSGNYSFRFYEALSCGRIPVFINTDCVLPYDFEIDWKQYCIWIEENELSIIDQKINDFHDKISAKEFVELQYECRKVWQERISPEGFFANLYRHISMLNLS
ncbi:MAG: hypothetical protein Kow0049_16500 [Stanieria sp.]